MLARAAASCLHVQRPLLARRAMRQGHSAVRTSAAGKDECMRSISDNGQVSILVVRGTELVQEVSEWGAGVGSLGTPQHYLPRYFCFGRNLL